MSTMIPYGNMFKQIVVTLPFTAIGAMAANTTSDKLIDCPGLLPTDQILGVNLDGPSVVGVFAGAWRPHQTDTNVLVVTMVNVTAATPAVSARNIRVVIGRTDSSQSNFA